MYECVCRLHEIFARRLEIKVLIVIIKSATTVTAIAVQSQCECGGYRPLK